MAAAAANRAKIDLKQSLGTLYKPRGSACMLVTPPLLNVLALEGTGDPNTATAWSEGVEALYSSAYTLKFMLKKSGATPDFSVMPLEALWWVSPHETFKLDEKDNWRWRAFIVQPDFVTAAHVAEALELARRKKSNPALARLTFGAFDEGPSAQVMHIGPFADEQPTVDRLNAFIHAQGFVQSGKHHEIYLSDPQRTAPVKLKTIIRLPIGQVQSHI